MALADPARVSATEHTLLSLLSASGASYGLQLVERSDDKLKRASIYVLLSRLEDRGFVKSSYIETPAGEQGPRRRVYEVTRTGQRVLRAWAAARRVWNG